MDRDDLCWLMIALAMLGLLVYGGQSGCYAEH